MNYLASDDEENELPESMNATFDLLESQLIEAGVGEKKAAELVDGFEEEAREAVADE